MMIVLYTFLFQSCGVITEQECDECVEDARFLSACRDYFSEEYGIIPDCYKDVELNPDNICTTEKIEEGICEYLGSYLYDDEVIAQLSTNYENCKGFFDYYTSCKNLKSNRKSGLNASDQRAYYDGKEESTGNYCRRWFWDDEEDWKGEKLIEKQACEEYADLYFTF